MALSNEFKEKWLNRLIWFCIFVATVIVLKYFTPVYDLFLSGAEKIGQDKQKIEKLIK